MAETGVKQAEDRLRLLSSMRAGPTVEPSNSNRPTRPPVAVVAIDMDGAVTNALRNSTISPGAQGHRKCPDVASARSNQRLPDVRAQRELPGERPRWNRGDANRRVSRNDRRSGQSRLSDRARSVVQKQLSDVGGGDQRLLSVRRSVGRGQYARNGSRRSRRYSA